MTSGEFHSHIVKIAKRCQFSNPQAKERAIRDAIFLGMNSQQARDKAINLMNEEGKELTVGFLMNQLAIEDCKNQGQNNSGAHGSSNQQSSVQKIPKNGREVHEMWKARAPARPEMSSQECKVQGMSQHRTLPQGMPIQEKRQES